MNAPLMSLDGFFSQLVSMYGHHLTEWEALLWESEVFSVYPERQIIKALKHYMEHDSSSRFMPRYGDIKRLLAQETASYPQLVYWVKKYGSYRAPSVDEAGDVMIKSIELLGGWTQVCYELPAIEDVSAQARYESRFNKASEEAVKRINVLGEAATPLLARNQTLLEKSDIKCSALVGNALDFNKSNAKMKGGKPLFTLKKILKEASLNESRNKLSP